MVVSLTEKNPKLNVQEIKGDGCAVNACVLVQVIKSNVERKNDKIM